MLINKKWITTALLVTTTAAALTGCGSSETAKSSDKPLIVGTEPSFPPFEMTENDTYVGFDIDLANAIGEKLGRKVEIKTMGFDALIPALKSGQIDLIASAMSATEERKSRSTLQIPIISAAPSSSSVRTTPTSAAGTTLPANRRRPGRLQAGGLR